MHRTDGQFQPTIALCVLRLSLFRNLFLEVHSANRLALLGWRLLAGSGFLEAHL